MIFRSANRVFNDRSITDFIASVAAELGKARPRHLIIDLRLDYGGDFTTTAKFLMSLRNFLEDDGTIYLLTSHVTFSAGILSAAYVQHGAPDHVVSIGQAVGDRERFWSESPGYSLPHSKMRLKYALQMHDVADGCEEPSICFPHHLAPVAVGSLSPDVLQPLTFEDYVNGRDAAIEKILSLAKE